MNDEEFSIRVEEAMPRFYRYARGLAYNEQDAEDIVQDALVKTYRQLDRLSGDPVHYVVRAVFSAYVDLKRKKMRHRETQLEHDPFYYDDELIKKLMRKELAERLEKAGRNVSERCRKIMYDFADDFTQEEVAARQGVAVGTVKSTLHRTRKTLQQILGDFNDLTI